MRQLIGIILLAAIAGLYAWWLRFLRRRDGASAAEENGTQTFRVRVKGVYAPNVLRAKLGTPVRITFHREESTDCSRFVNFPDFRVRKELPEGRDVAVELTPDRAGEFTFTCDMSMYRGTLVIE